MLTAFCASKSSSFGTTPNGSVLIYFSDWRFGSVSNLQGKRKLFRKTGELEIGGEITVFDCREETNFASSYRKMMFQEIGIPRYKEMFKLNFHLFSNCRKLLHFIL